MVPPPALIPREVPGTGKSWPCLFQGSGLALKQLKIKRLGEGKRAFQGLAQFLSPLGPLPEKPGLCLCSPSVHRVTVPTLIWRAEQWARESGCWPLVC